MTSREVESPQPSETSEDSAGRRLENSRLRERLARLKGEGSPSAEPTLKERLERLVKNATRRDSRKVMIEEIPGGKRVRNRSGEFLLVERDFSLDTLHGHVSLSRLAATPVGSLAILSGGEDPRGFDGAAFLDTETTGLSGGSGTAAFLTGIGFVEKDRFVVRQYFMRDYHEEPAVFESLTEDLQEFSVIVTYNGKIFDLPLLESRFRLNRRSSPLAASLHVDLLHPSRRLWKARLGGCSLQDLEGPVLGFHRVNDIRGDQIPGMYFEFLRSRDGRGIERIFDHNRLDILSLAALAAHACRWVDGGLAEDPRDLFSLARVLERAGEHERSLSHYQSAVDAGPGPVQGAALHRLGREAKRAGDPGALELFERAGEAGDALALRELAIHYEHRSEDFGRALSVTERALRLVAKDGPRQLKLDLQRRLERLRRKATKTPRAGSRRETSAASSSDDP